MEKMFGVMFDCSRNGVLKVETVKKYADILKKMGYNTLMLYTEDTYEVDNQPLFGYMRGRYTKEEMKEIDDYCYNLGIEVVPCMQTLAHLENFFKWKFDYEDIRDYDNVLLAQEEKTYKLIDDMFSTFSECFRSRRIHIGMDEAYMVGLGKYRKKHGIKDRFEVINNHLHKVCEMAAKYNYETMVWHDMFYNLALDEFVGDEPRVAVEKMGKRTELPENVSIVYWDYYSTEYNHFVNVLDLHKGFNRKVCYAGGAWTWKGFMPNNKYSIETMEAAIKACNDVNIDDAFITVWGDDGNECSKFSILPSLMYAAEVHKGNTDMDSIKKKFKEIVGADFDAFLILDEVDKPGGKCDNFPNKYLLYNDLFTGLNDWRCDDDIEKYYENLAKKIADVKGKGEYEYLFNTLQKLCEIFAVKANLGNKIRKAYVEKNFEELKKLAALCDTVIERVEAFYDTFKKQWFIDNKPYGFDVQEIRLGGTMLRIKSCKERILDFVDGKIDEIPELSEKIIESKTVSLWSRTVSANAISQYL